jgi:hypothetical protein
VVLMLVALAAASGAPQAGNVVTDERREGVGIMNLRAICPNCGGKLHTQPRGLGHLTWARSGPLVQTGATCQWCGAALSGKVGFDNKAIAADDPRIRKQEERRAKRTRKQEELKAKKAERKARTEELDELDNAILPAVQDGLDNKAIAADDSRTMKNLEKTNRPGKGSAAEALLDALLAAEGPLDMHGLRTQLDLSIGEMAGAMKYLCREKLVRKRGRTLELC